MPAARRPCVGKPTYGAAFPEVRSALDAHPRNGTVGESVLAKATRKTAFNVETFLATVNGGRTVSMYKKNQEIFSQGDPADAVFYIQEGKVKVCVISESGKEAVVAGKEGKKEPVIAKISQETLAEMVGTTRSRVSGFMNKFRQLGLRRIQRRHQDSQLFVECGPARQTSNQTRCRQRRIISNVSGFEQRAPSAPLKFGELECRVEGDTYHDASWSTLTVSTRPKLSRP
jgi:hypothetical protein